MADLAYKLPGGPGHPATLGTWLYLLPLCRVFVLLHLVGPTKSGGEKSYRHIWMSAQNPRGLVLAHT